MTLIGKYLDKWVLSRAKEIEKKKTETEKKDKLSYDEKKNLDEYFTNKARDLIYKEIEKLETDFEKEECHIQAGDTAYLNLYDIKYNSRNNWDTGAYQIYRVLDDRNMLSNELPKVKIKEVKIGWELVYEYTSLYLDECAYQWLEEKIDNGELVGIFLSWLQRKIGDSSIFKPYGLYKVAKFEGINFDKNLFKYGINVNSFIKDDTEEGEVSVEMYKNEIKKKVLEKEVEVLRKKIKEISENHSKTISLHQNKH